MAQLLIALRRDPATGRQNIVVKLDSEPDALPVEHEQLHRQLVEKLIGTGISAEDLGHLIIEREVSRDVESSERSALPGEGQHTKSANAS
jgi:hypothetical protein